MKKLLLLTFCLIAFVATAHAQKSKLHGHWRSDESSVEYDVFISKGAGGQSLTIQALDHSDGEVLTVTEAKLVSDRNLTFHLFTPSTNWNVDCEFKLLSKKKLEEIVTGDGQATMVYTKSGPPAKGNGGLAE